MNRLPQDLPGTPVGATAWIVTHGAREPHPSTRLRLFCFSYAGGSAGIYQPWRASLDPNIQLCAIQLPGRSTRIREAPLRDLDQIVATLAPLIAARADLPFAFFGHSLGALVAFELARHLQRRGLPMPTKLIASGASAPQHRSEIQALDEHDDQKMIEALARYNGTPTEILHNRELMQILAPAIRADFAIAADYRYLPGDPLQIPLTAFAGRDDDSSEAQAEAWQLETEGPFALHWFDGGHFFIHSQAARVLVQLNAELSAAALDRSQPSNATLL